MLRTIFRATTKNVLAPLLALASLSGQADAGLITYNYKTTLALATGPDTSGLDSATVEIKVDVDSNAVYVLRYEKPAVIMNNDAIFTITGSSVALNNGTFSLGQLAFFPAFAGLFTDPAGGTPFTVLPVSDGILGLAANTLASVHGASAHVGDMIDIRDFAPAVSEGGRWTVTNTTATYFQVGPTITASLVLTIIPEPESLVLLGTGLFVLMAIRRRGESRSQPLMKGGVLRENGRAFFEQW